MTGSEARHPFPHLLVARSVGAVAMLGIALIHLLDLPGKLAETPYLGVAYIGLILASLLTAGLLVATDDLPAWQLGGGLALATIAGYVINRTVGLPGAMEDIGNWLEPLGLASLFVEGVMVTLTGWVLARRAGSRASAPGSTRPERVGAI